LWSGLDGGPERTRALAADVAVVVEVQEPEPMVDGDRERVHQLVVNLVANAVRHSPPGATVLIRAAQPAAGGSVELEVRDDGPGIPPEAAARVFERFYRLDAARAADDGGAGAGLALPRAVPARTWGSVPP